jgi:hypothetical protein
MNAAAIPNMVPLEDEGLVEAAISPSDFDLETVAVRRARRLDEFVGVCGADLVGVLAEVHRCERDVAVSAQLPCTGGRIRRSDARHAGQTCDLGERRVNGGANRRLGDLRVFGREDDSFGVAGDARRRLLKEVLRGSALRA